MPERESPAKSTAKSTTKAAAKAPAKAPAPKPAPKAAQTSPKAPARKPKAKAAAKAQAQPTEAERTMNFVVEAARLLSDDKCEDVVILDVRKLSQVTDFVVIGSGTSDRQMRSVLKHVEELGGTLGYRAFRVSADERAVWLLADFVHVVVHLFEPNTRAHYDLEMLWGDAERVEWERPSQKTRNRAGLREGDGVAG